MKLDQKRKVAADFWTGGPMRRNLIQENMEPILRLASLSELRISHDHLNPAGAAVRSTASFELRIPYGDTVDKPAEIARLKKEIDRLAKDIESKQTPPRRRKFHKQGARKGRRRAARHACRAPAGTQKAARPPEAARIVIRRCLFLLQSAPLRAGRTREILRPGAGLRMTQAVLCSHSSLATRHFRHVFFLFPPMPTKRTCEPARHHRPAHRRAADAARRKLDHRDQRREDRQGNRRHAPAGVALDREAARSSACA